VKSILTEQGRDAVIKRRNEKGLSRILFEDNPLGRAFVFWKSKKAVLEKIKAVIPLH